MSAGGANKSARHLKKAPGPKDLGLFYFQETLAPNERLNVALFPGGLTHLDDPVLEAELVVRKTAGRGLTGSH